MINLILKSSITLNLKSVINVAKIKANMLFDDKFEEFTEMRIHE